MTSITIRTKGAGTRAELAMIAERSKLHGDSIDSIAYKIGRTKAYVYELLNDPTGAKARERKRRNGGACRVCGKRTDGSRGRALAPAYCVQHYNQRSRFAAQPEPGDGQSRCASDLCPTLSTTGSAARLSAHRGDGPDGQPWRYCSSCIPRETGLASVSAHRDRFAPGYDS